MNSLSCTLNIFLATGYSKLKPKLKVVDHIRVYRWKKKNVQIAVNQLERIDKFYKKVK